MRWREVFQAIIFALALGLTTSAWAAQHGTAFRVLHNFGASGDGAMPYGPPLLEGGKLYGVTINGGTGMCSDYGCGTVFELALVNGKVVEHIVHDFADNGDGSGPEGNLVTDAEGNLYGTLSGAAPAQTAVFQLESDGWLVRLIYSQVPGDGGVSPGLVIDGVGNIFGIIGGSIYGAMGELSLSGGEWNYTDLYNFCDPNNCLGFPANPVSMDAKGNLYGTDYFGGVAGDGVAYQLVPGPDSSTGTETWTYNLMHTFGVSYIPQDGRNPNGGLTLDSLGNAYGTTVVGGGCGGSVGCGTVSKLTPSQTDPGAWTETILYDFPGDSNCSQGCAPAYELVFDKAGNLYGLNGGGLTCPGGAPCGMVYKLTPTKSGPWKYSIVHEFNGTDGEYPHDLTIDSEGNLYGVTTMGGLYNNGGVVFMITP